MVSVLEMKTFPILFNLGDLVSGDGYTRLHCRDGLRFLFCLSPGCSGPAERSKPTFIVCTLLHSLNCVLQEVTHEVSLIAEGLNFVRIVAVLIKKSAKRKQLFESLFGCEDIIVKILGLNPM